MIKPKFMRKFLTIIMAFLVTASFAQQKKVTGVVTDKKTHSPLAGVTVQSKKQMVTTDTSGRFSITTAVGETLVFSYVGMKALNVPVTASTDNLTLDLEVSESDLTQVVVTGY